MKKMLDRGSVHTFTLTASKLEDNNREIFVYLPPFYHEGAYRYPVLYMHDGQNIFFNRYTTFKSGSWAIHKALDQLYQETGKGFIVVGVNSSDKNRTREMGFLPFKKSSGYAHYHKKIAQGPLYELFFTQELKSYIDKTYRTNPNLSYIGGSSMGGIAALLMALRNPGLYQGALCFTPAGLVHYQDTLKTLFLKQLEQFDALGISYPKLYFMVGGIGLERKIKPFCDFAVPFFVQQGYEYGKNISYLYKPRSSHNEKAWARVFPDAFRWLIK